MNRYSTSQQSLALWFIDTEEVNGTERIKFPRTGFVAIPNNSNSYDFCLIGKDVGFLPELGFLEKIDYLDIKRTLKKYGGVVNDRPTLNECE